MQVFYFTLLKKKHFGDLRDCARYETSSLIYFFRSMRFQDIVSDSIHTKVNLSAIPVSFTFYIHRDM